VIECRVPENGAVVAKVAWVPVKCVPVGLSAVAPSLKITVLGAAGTIGPITAGVIVAVNVNV